MSKFSIDPLHVPFKPIRKRFKLNRFRIDALNRFPNRFGQTTSRGGLKPFQSFYAVTLSVWTDNEVQALISIWSDSTVQNQLDDAVRNKVVFDKLAKKLKENWNVERDWKQCRDKINFFF